jgi:hemerythrin-like domain-containing protein
MQPIGPLMREHRLIERMVAVLNGELERMRSGGAANVSLLDSGVDFFRFYADRTHHGKEEDILFRDLAKREISPVLKAIMEDLLNEHVYARGKVSRLVEARNRLVGGDALAMDEIIATLAELVVFYPVHILKEDRRFFFPCQEYFSREEQDAMLDEFREFDRQLIHEKYMKAVEELEA